MTSDVQEKAGGSVPVSAADLVSVYAEEEHHKPIYSASEIPNSYESITNEWLTDVLCKDAPGSKVVGFELGDRDDGSANRRRMVVHYNAAGTEAGLPTHLFCKSADQLQNRQVLGPSGVALAEINFYAKARPILDIEAPVCYYSRFNPQNCAFMIILSDLTDHCELGNEKTDMDWSRAAGQMDLLARLHGRFYESPLLGTERLPFRTFQQTWRDMTTAMPLWEAYADKGFEDSEDFMPAHLFKRRDEIWPATQKGAALHDELPRTIIHCDVHLTNWYITNENRMGLLDWQITSIGHWSRDVAYAMTTALTVENRRKWEKDLIRFYLEKLAEYGGPTVSEADALLFFRRQLAGVLSMWTITFRPAPGMPEYHPEERSIEFLKRIYAAIDDHDALDSF